MIPLYLSVYRKPIGKPRASGDDPRRPISP